jgi:hypothetical protein
MVTKFSRHGVEDVNVLLRDLQASQAIGGKPA